VLGVCGEAEGAEGINPDALTHTDGS
jgi:hypothetical protein